MQISLRRITDYHSEHIKLPICGNYVDINCDCAMIEKVSFFKYLGVVFEFIMSWPNHIDILVKTRRNNLFAYRHLRDVLEEKEIKLTYYGFIQYLLTFFNFAWGGASMEVNLKGKFCTFCS